MSYETEMAKKLASEILRGNRVAIIHRNYDAFTVCCSRFDLNWRDCPFFYVSTEDKLYGWRGIILDLYTLSMRQRIPRDKERAKDFAYYKARYEPDTEILYGEQAERVMVLAMEKVKEERLIMKNPALRRILNEKLDRETLEAGMSALRQILDRQTWRGE